MSGQCNFIHKTGGGRQPDDSELESGSFARGCIYFQDILKVNVLTSLLALSFSDGINLLE